MSTGPDSCRLTEVHALVKDRSRHPVGKRNISAKTVSQSFIFLVVERCYLLCNVLPTVYVTRMQILHQYFKVNKQHAQFSNKQTMTMISASDFLSKCFSKMRKLFVQSRAQLPCDSFMLCLVSVTISEDDIFKT